MEAGARVEVAPYKKDPMDFVLWKPSKPGEPAWPRPCGIAAPGGPAGTSNARRWRDACSARSSTFTAAASTSMFPHHENEIAQIALRSRHAGDGERLDAQRLPAGRRREDVEEPRQLRHHPRAADSDWPGEVLRFNMLRHALPPADRLDDEGPGGKSEDADRWYASRRPRYRRPHKRPRDVVDALEDDLNTPKAIAELHGYAARRTSKTGAASAFRLRRRR